MMLKTRQKGQSLAEYGLILALIAIVCIAALQGLGGSIKNNIDQVNNQLQSANQTTGTGGTKTP